MAYKLNPITGKLDYYEAAGGGILEIGGEVVDGTPGSVLFIDADGNLTQDNPNFSWDDTDNILKISKRISLYPTAADEENFTLYRAGSTSQKGLTISMDSGANTVFNTLNADYIFKQSGTTLFATSSLGLLVNNPSLGGIDQTLALGRTNANTTRISLENIGGTALQAFFGLTAAGYEVASTADNDFYFINTNKGFAFSVDGGTTANLYLNNAGKLGVGTTSPTSLLDINSDILRLRTAKTPATSGASGNQGDICWDSGYLYVCIATNTWQRVATATW